MVKKKEKTFVNVLKMLMLKVLLSHVTLFGVSTFEKGLRKRLGGHFWNYRKSLVPPTGQEPKLRLPPNHHGLTGGTRV